MDLQALDPPDRLDSPRKRSCSPSIPSSDAHDQKRQKMLPDAKASQEVGSESATVGNVDGELAKSAEKSSQQQGQEIQDEHELKVEDSKSDTVEEVKKNESVRADEAKADEVEISESIKQDAKEGIDEDDIGEIHFRAESSQSIATESDTAGEIAAISEKFDLTESENGSERQGQIPIDKPKDDNMEDAKVMSDEVKEEKQNDEKRLSTIETESGHSDDDVRNRDIIHYLSDIVVYVSIDSKDAPDSSINMEDVVARLGIREERPQLAASSDTVLKQENFTAPDVKPAKILRYPGISGLSPPSEDRNAANEVDTGPATEFMPGLACDKTQKATTDPRTEVYDQGGHVQPQPVTTQDSTSPEETSGAHIGEQRSVFEKVPRSSETQDGMPELYSNTQSETTTQQVELEGNRTSESQIEQLPLFHFANKPPCHATAAVNDVGVDAAMKDPDDDTICGPSTALPPNTLHKFNAHVDETKHDEPIDSHLSDNHTRDTLLQASVEDANNTDEVDKSLQPLPGASSNQASKDAHIVQRRSARIQKHQEAKNEKAELVLNSENGERRSSKPARTNAKSRICRPESAVKTDTPPGQSVKKDEVKKSRTTATNRKSNNSTEKVLANNKNIDTRPLLFSKTSCVQKGQLTMPSFLGGERTLGVSAGSTSTLGTNIDIDTDDSLHSDEVGSSDLNSSVDHAAPTLNRHHVVAASNKGQAAGRDEYSQYPYQYAPRRTSGQLPYRLEVGQTSGEAHNQNSNCSRGPSTDAPMHEGNVAGLSHPDPIQDTKSSLLKRFRTVLHKILNHDDHGVLIAEVIDEIHPFVGNKELMSMVMRRQFSDEDLERMGLMRNSNERPSPPELPLHDFYGRDRELIRLDTPFVECRKPHSVKVSARLSTSSHSNYVETILSSAHAGTSQNTDRGQTPRNGDQAMFGDHDPSIFAPYTQQAIHSTNNWSDVISIDSSDDEAGTLPNSRKLPTTRLRSSSGATGSSNPHCAGGGDSQKSSPLDGRKSVFSSQNTPSGQVKNRQMRYQAPGIAGSGRPTTGHTTSSINADENPTNLVHGLKLGQYLHDVEAIHWSLAAEKIPHLLDHKSWGCTNVRHEEESFRALVQKNQRSSDNGYSVMDGFPLVEDVQFVVSHNEADPDGDCYWRALATCLHGTTGAWDVAKAEHLAYLHHVLKRPMHPRHKLYRDSLISKLYTVQSPARGKFDANLWQLLHMPHAWVPAAMQQITADLYNVMLVTFSTDDRGNLYEVNTRGSYNSRHIFMLFTGGNHYCPMFPNEFMPWEFRYPRPTLESTAKYECGPDPARTMRRKACQHSWRSDITKSVMPPVPRLHGYPIDKLRTLMSANRLDDW